MPSSVEIERVTNNAKLTNIKVTGYELSFNKETNSYSINIGDENKLDIQTLVEDSKSNVTVTGNENLKDGSVITVKVTAEDGSTINSYTINVKKNASEDVSSGTNTSNWIKDNIIYFAIADIVLIIAIIIGSIYDKRSIKAK
jgi:hypothetical protein